MAENINDLIQEIIKQLTSTCKEQTYSFNQSIDCTAENLSMLTCEAIRQVETLEYSRDVVVDTAIRSIYLKDSVPLEILTLLPLKYPEMDPTPYYRHIPYFSTEYPPKVKEVECSSYVVQQGNEIIGHVSYHGPGDCDPIKGIITVGHKTNLSLEKPVKRSVIDIDIEVPKMEDKEDKNE